MQSNILRQKTNIYTERIRFDQASKIKAENGKFPNFSVDKYVFVCYNSKKYLLAAVYNTLRLRKTNRFSGNIIKFDLPGSFP